ncbi:MAG: hypothetical protein ACK55I_07200, partial [bacterium]
GSLEPPDPQQPGVVGLAGGLHKPPGELPFRATEQRSGSRAEVGQALLLQPLAYIVGGDRALQEGKAHRIRPRTVKQRRRSVGGKGHAALLAAAALGSVKQV